ncbi:WbqC family protein [Sphingobacterium sp. MYb382]|uniref:WbqC family protein n=1 Tax=Sphingobacterium sp. MYb382 TaxID=2745278 RepID=UPI0030B6CAA5
MESKLLLPAFYLAPVSYFHVIKAHESPILIEQHEHYPKQTFRTRTRIATANGVLELFIPIQHGRKMHVPFKDIRISYDHDWQRLHWMSLEAAYRSSAYFEFYEDDFARFYQNKFEFLLDYQVEQLQLMLKCFKLDREIGLTDSYEKTDAETDYRQIIHPKKDSVWANPKPYYQVFEEKNGFIADVSAVDLLFNQGPQSKLYL